MPPESATLVSLFAAVTVPPAHVVAPDAEAVLTRLAGYVSVNAAPFTATAFALLSVIVSTRGAVEAPRRRARTTSAIDGWGRDRERGSGTRGRARIDRRHGAGRVRIAPRGAARHVHRHRARASRRYGGARKCQARTVVGGRHRGPGAGGRARRARGVHEATRIGIGERRPGHRRGVAVGERDGEHAGVVHRADRGRREGASATARPGKHREARIRRRGAGPRVGGRDRAAAR